MGNLTKNLSRHEFACKCGCGYDVPDFETVTILQELADYYSDTGNSKVIIEITSGNRCYHHNELTQKIYKPGYIPGSSKSKHVNGGAADFKLFYFTSDKKIQISPLHVYEYLDKKYPNRLGLGLYVNRNHIDPRHYKARWEVKE